MGPTAQQSHGGAAATTFVLVTVAINAVGFGIIIPVLPSLLMELAATDAAGAAVWGGLASFVFAIMQFFCSPVVGGLSDRFGRRPVLLVSLGALAMDFLLMGLAHALWVFFLARTLSGIFSATNSTANAYIADVTPPDQRSAKYGLLGAAFGFGFILGPLIGGLLGEFGPRAPFYAAAALAAAGTVYGYFAIPESLQPEKRRAFSWKRSNIYGTLKQLRSIAGLEQLALVYFLTSLSGFAYPAVWAYVAIAKFDWSEAQIGYSVAFYGLCFALSQAVMIPLLMKRLGETRVVWLGLLVEGVALIGIATAPSTLVLYLWMTTTLFSAMQTPALQKLMTSSVAEDQQGELQGGLSALSGLVLIITPLLYTQIFFLFERGVSGIVFPGAPFLVAAAFNLLALLVLLGPVLLRRAR